MKYINKSKKHYFFLLGTLVVLFLAFQYLVIFHKVNELKNSNKILRESSQIKQHSINDIIYCNTNLFIEDDNISNSGIFLFISYPVCEACFKGVIHHLDKYAENKNMQFVVLCESNYIPLLKKKLRFDGLEHIKVYSLDNYKLLSTRMIIIFKPNSGNIFYLPLPEKQEINFLEAFLKSE